MKLEWIKLSLDIFDNRKIKQIEKLYGYEYIVAWFKLIVLSGKVNRDGFLFVAENIPFNADSLSVEFDMDVDLIEEALSVFGRFQMIEQLNGVLHICNWEKYQNVETLDKVREQNRLRKQKQRAKEKDIVEAKNDDDCDNNVTCHVTVTGRHATEEEIRIRNKNKNNKKFIKPTLEELESYIRETSLNVDAQKFIDYYESNGWMVGRNHMKDWKATVRRWGKTQFSNGVKKNDVVPDYYDKQIQSEGNASPEDIERVQQLLKGMK